MAVALASAGCSKWVMDPLRLDITHTFWSYSIQDQTARIAFPDGEHASIVQMDMASRACQALHGTYTLDGHRVLLTGDNWPDNIKFVRTFTHLKNNSTNKNLTPLAPVTHKSLAGSVWTTMSDNNLNIVFFDHDGTCLDATYINAIRKEGLKYGWQWNRKDYSFNGSNLAVGGVTATTFEDFIQVGNISVLNTAPAVEHGGSSALVGTIWTYITPDFPGLIVFTSDSTFTRVLVSSGVVYTFLNGTYRLSGTTLSMTDGADINETCQVSDRFTFSEKEYVKVSTLR